MAKSSLTKGSNKVRHVRNNKSIVPLNFTIPCKRTKDKIITNFDVSHLLHLGTDKTNDKVLNRIPYIRSFCNKAKKYVDNGNSATTVTSYYKNLDAYMSFCDARNLNPFSEAGYLKYAGNDGELRHRIKAYKPSKKIWKRVHGEELGIKESTACVILSHLRTALLWCGLPVKSWQILHKGYKGERTQAKGYSDAEEKILVSRLSELFFALAPQLIAVKNDNLILPDELPVTINLGGYTEVISIPTSLKTNKSVKEQNNSSVRSIAAFNVAMGAAYHLMCFFTSLNDTNIRSIAHPIEVHTDKRDKSLKTVKVSSFKARSSKEVDALLTNETDASLINFDVDKRDGVTFITMLEELSKLYGSATEGDELLFVLNKDNEVSDKFNITEINKHLTLSLNLISPHRSSCIPWFIKLFDTYRKQKYIEIKTTINNLGRLVTHKKTHPMTSKVKATQGATSASYCILSCYTNLPLKGILLPLSYSQKDDENNITISFKYRNGNNASFIIPATDKSVIQNIEQFATELADKQRGRNYDRLLLKRGSGNNSPKDWEGISPISANLMNRWAIEPNDYFISLQSSRWRETTSSQEYDDNNIVRVQNILQNTIETINKHYANGDPLLNKTILSQGMQVLEQMAKGLTLNKAKEHVAKIYAIPMLTYDEWQKRKKENETATNPNGTTCNGKQDTPNGNNSQRETNKAMGVKLPCTEYDMCYKCNSAKAVNEVQAVYKLISFIDILKEVLNQYPNAKGEIFEKIAAFEYTLDGASTNVYEEAVDLFNKNGRHPRVSIDHAILSIYRY